MSEELTVETNKFIAKKLKDAPIDLLKEDERKNCFHSSFKKCEVIRWIGFNN